MLIVDRERSTINGVFHDILYWKSPKFITLCHPISLLIAAFYEIQSTH